MIMGLLDQRAAGWPAIKLGSSLIKTRELEAIVNKTEATCLGLWKIPNEN